VRVVSAMLLIGALAQPLPVARVQQGGAAHYSPGVMERVSRFRGMPVVGCMIASIHYPKLGTWVTVHSRKTGAVELCRVTDVTRKRDIPTMQRRNIVVELNFAAAKRLCAIHRPNQEPPRACQVTIGR
jgi:hypothetical protein